MTAWLLFAGACTFFGLIGFGFWADIGAWYDMAQYAVLEELDEDAQLAESA